MTPLDGATLADADLVQLITVNETKAREVVAELRRLRTDNRDLLRRLEEAELDLRQRDEALDEYRQLARAYEIKLWEK